jgi:hypothetical protein
MAARVTDSPSQRNRYVSRAICAAALLIACGLAASRAQAQASSPDARVVLGEAEVWGLAEALFADGEYYRAVTEYKRLSFYFPHGPHAATAQERIAQALLLGGEPRQALDVLSARLASATGPERDRALLLRAIGWLDLNADRPMPERKPDVARALADLKAVDPASPDASRATGFAQAVETPPDLPRKSPALAGTLSAVLPGAGSLYDGRPAEAALAFTLNALLISATVTAFQEHQGGLGTGLGVLALAFYGGNVYAAVSGAHKFNDRAEAAYLDEQRTRFGLVLERGRIGAAFQRNF